MNFHALVAQGEQVAIVAEVEEFIAAAFCGFSGEVVQLVVAVEVDLEGLVPGFMAVEELFLDVGLAGRGEKRGQPVFARKNVGEAGAGLDHARPADKGRDAPAAFPVRVFLAAEGRGAGVREEADHRAVVGGVNDDGVLCQAEIIDGLEQLADEGVVLDHAVGVEAKPGLAEVRLLHMGEVVHPRGVEPAEERLSGLLGAGEEILGRREHLLVDRLHALHRQRAGVLDLAAGVALITPRGPNFFLNSGFLG